MEEGDDNDVNASASTLPLIIFGGEGNNTIIGGQGGDTIFSHEGLIDYTDSAGNLITRLGLGLSERTTLEPGQTATTDTDVPYYQNNNLFNPATLIETRNDAQNTGVDTITAGAGNNIILAEAGDTINAGNGNNIIIAGYGQIAGTPAGVITSIESASPAGGVGDTITAGNGNNIVIGAAGNNTITAGNGNNIIFGDNGTIDYGSTGVLTSVATTSPTVAGNNTITTGNGNNIILGGTDRTPSRSATAITRSSAMMGISSFSRLVWRASSSQRTPSWQRTM